MMRLPVLLLLGLVCAAEPARAQVVPDSGHRPSFGPALQQLQRARCDRRRNGGHRDDAGTGPASSTLLQVPVVDRTNLQGMFEMTTRFETLDLPGTSRVMGARPGASTTRDLPSLLSALREDLGLKLETERVPVKSFTVERVERPAEN